MSSSIPEAVLANYKVDESGPEGKWQSDIMKGPYKIVEATGMGYLLGCGGGSVWHGWNVYKNSPKGDFGRTAFHTMRMRAPVMGASFAAWSGLYTFLEILFPLKRRYDHWTNVVAAGGLTGAILSFKAGGQGWRSSLLVGGGLLGGIELLSYGLFEFSHGSREQSKLGVTDKNANVLSMESLKAKLSSGGASDMKARKEAEMLFQIDERVNPREIGYADDDY